MTSPVQRRRTIDQERYAGFAMLGAGVVIVSLSVVRLAIDPTFVWQWAVGLLGVVQIAAGIVNLRRSKRKLAELEREHGPGAGSDQQLRSKHGL
jgi:uncharacterized membrane protein YdcZ (DUF606 family)